MRSILPLFALGFGDIGAVRAREPVLHEPTVLLFGANWCAPCRVELDRLNQIVAAARPAEVLLVWLDHAPSLDRMPAGVRIATRAETVGLVHAFAQDAAGVPHAVLTDGAGVVCARHPGVIDERRLLHLMRQCGLR